MVSRRRWAAGLGLLLGGCRGQGMEVGDSRLGTGTSEGETASPRPSSSCPDAVALRLSDEDCWPTRHVGHWRGFVTGDARYQHVFETPFEYPSDALLLEIDEQGGATLTFAPPDAGNRVLPAEPAPGLLLGYRYALEALSMSGGPSDARRLDPSVNFSLTIAEPWASVCGALGAAEASAPCVCGDRGCGAAPDVLGAGLLLSADANALRGFARSDTGPLSPLAVWEFVRE